jgi:hypothetical protein
MRSAPLGSPARGVVCLVAARGRGTTACVPCPGAATAPGPAITPSRVQPAGPVTGRMP